MGIAWLAVTKLVLFIKPVLLPLLLFFLNLRIFLKTFVFPFAVEAGAADTPSWAKISFRPQINLLSISY